MAGNNFRKLQNYVVMEIFILWGLLWKLYMPAKVEGALAVSKKRKAIRVFLHVTFCLFLVLPIIASNVQGLSNFHKMKTSAESNVTILWTAPAAWGSGVAISDDGEYITFVNGTYSYSDYTYRYYLVLMTKSGQKVFEIPLNAERLSR